MIRIMVASLQSSKVSRGSLVMETLGRAYIVLKHEPTRAVPTLYAAGIPSPTTSGTNGHGVDWLVAEQDKVHGKSTQEATKQIQLMDPDGQGAWMAMPLAVITTVGTRVESFKAVNGRGFMRFTTSDDSVLDLAPLIVPPGFPRKIIATYLGTQYLH